MKSNNQKGKTPSKSASLTQQYLEEQRKANDKAVNYFLACLKKQKIGTLGYALCQRDLGMGPIIAFLAEQGIQVTEAEYKKLEKPAILEMLGIALQKCEAKLAETPEIINRADEEPPASEIHAAGAGSERMQEEVPVEIPIRIKRNLQHYQQPEIGNHNFVDPSIDPGWGNSTRKFVYC